MSPLSWSSSNLNSRYFFLNHELFGRMKKIMSRPNFEPARKEQLKKVAPCRLVRGLARTLSFSFCQTANDLKNLAGKDGVVGPSLCSLCPQLFTVEAINFLFLSKAQIFTYSIKLRRKIAQNTKYDVIDLIFINLETLEIVTIVGDS